MLSFIASKVKDGPPFTFGAMKLSIPCFDNIERLRSVFSAKRFGVLVSLRSQDDHFLPEHQRAIVFSAPCKQVEMPHLKGQVVSLIANIAGRRYRCGLRRIRRTGRVILHAVYPPVAAQQLYAHDAQGE